MGRWQCKINCPAIQNRLHSKKSGGHVYITLSEKLVNDYNLLRTAQTKQQQYTSCDTEELSTVHYVFLRSENKYEKDRPHKQPSITEGPYPLMSIDTDAKTLFIVCKAKTVQNVLTRCSCTSSAPSRRTSSKITSDDLEEDQSQSPYTPRPKDSPESVPPCP